MRARRSAFRIFPSTRSARSRRCSRSRLERNRARLADGAPDRAPRASRPGGGTHPEHSWRRRRRRAKLRHRVRCAAVGGRRGRVFHDSTLDRLMEASGQLGQRSVADLQALRFKGTNERIPTLREFLGRVAGRVPLICEIKSHFDGDMRLTDRTRSVAAGYSGRSRSKASIPPSSRICARTAAICRSASSPRRATRATIGAVSPRSRSKAARRSCTIRKPGPTSSPGTSTTSPPDARAAARADFDAGDGLDGDDAGAEAARQALGRSDRVRRAPDSGVPPTPG